MGDKPRFIKRISPSVNWWLCQNLPSQPALGGGGQENEQDAPSFPFHFTPALAAASGSMAWRALVAVSRTRMSEWWSAVKSDGMAGLASAPNLPSAWAAEGPTPQLALGA